MWGAHQLIDLIVFSYFVTAYVTISLSGLLLRVTSLFKL